MEKYMKTKYNAPNAIKNPQGDEISTKTGQENNM